MQGYTEDQQDEMGAINDYQHRLELSSSTEQDQLVIYH